MLGWLLNVGFAGGSGGVAASFPAHVAASQMFIAGSAVAEVNAAGSVASAINAAGSVIAEVAV